MGNICDENGVPLGITLVLSTLTGCSVSKKAGKYLLTDEVSGVVTEYTAEEVQSLLKKAGVLENAVAGKKVLTGGITDGAQKAVRDIKAAEGAGVVVRLVLCGII